MMDSPSQLFGAALSDHRLLDAAGPLMREPCEALARRLEKAGVMARQGVALCFENGRQCIEAYIALSLLDAVAVPLPPTLPEDERLRLWRSLRCDILVDAAGVRPIVEGAHPTPAWPDGIHWVMHSSGSTGVPKAIPLTYSAVVANSHDVIRFVGVAPGATHLGSMSQCYTNGLFNSFLLPLITEGRAYVGPIGSIVSFAAYQTALRTARADVLWVNPPVVSALTRRGRQEDVAHAVVLISCTAPLDQRICAEAEQALRKPVLQSYGLTETLIVSVEVPARSVADEFSAGLPVSASGSVRRNANGLLEIENGAVTPGYATISDDRLLFDLPGGEPGRSFVAADLVDFDAGGRLHIRGRANTVINVGGVKVSAEQLEQALRAWPGVTNAAVVAMPYAAGLERPVALLEAEQELDLVAIADHCTSLFGRAARPAEIKRVSRIPLTANGKIDRRALDSLMKPRSR